MSKAYQEYIALKSINEKLTFRANGRPGVNDIRLDQERIVKKITAYAHKKGLEVKHNFNAKPSYFKGVCGVQLPHKPYYQTPYTPKDFLGDVRTIGHDIRQKRVDEFLAKLDDWKRDIENGSPWELFTGKPTGVNMHADNQRPMNVFPLGNGWFYKQDEDVTWDNNCYSKSWHLAHGGKKSVSNRRVIFKRMTKSGPETRIAYLEAWRGDWLAKAVEEAGLAPKKSSAPLSIRLNKSYDAELISEKRGYKIYSRTLVGKHVDYVIKSPMGVIYHDEKRENLIRGLHFKIRSGAGKLFTGEIIDWSLCKKLGFCDSGIKSFCSEFGFNPKNKYTASEIYRAVKLNISKAAPYLSELKTLANAIDFKVPEFN